MVVPWPSWLLGRLYVDGNARQHGIARWFVEPHFVGEYVAVDARMSARDMQSDMRAIMAPAVRNARDARQDIVRDFDRDLNRTNA